MAPAFVQLPELPGFDDPRTCYREGFRDAVEALGGTPGDPVLLLEPAPARARRLRERWADWPGAMVVESVTGTGTARLHCAPGSDPEAVSTDPGYVARFCGARESASWHVAAVDLRTWAGEHGRITHLAADPRWDVTPLLDVPWALVDRASIVIADGIAEDLEALRAALSAAGLAPAGRAFGEARAVTTFARARSAADRARRAVAKARVGAGEALVRAREQHASRLLPWRRGWVDPEPGRALDPIDRGTVERAIRAIDAAAGTTWDEPALGEPDPDDLARECHERHGLWPISFSYPRLRPIASPHERLSAIVPGFPYAFDDDDAYLAHYARASMAITHRKAGWDCFRHVEILAAGAVPVMLDAADIPRFSMVHYPKAALARIARRAASGEGIPGEATRRSLRAHAERHLTSEAMARYMLRAIGSDPGTVLFIDDQMPVNPEYQSSLALIGLKAVLGTRVDVAFPADFLYRGSRESARGFYGRGFGYSHAIDPRHRTASEEAGTMKSGLQRMGEYDLVVVGSVQRNPTWVPEVLRACSPSKVVLIHGEDSPPSPAGARWLRSTGAHVFVRAIHDRTR